MFYWNNFIDRIKNKNTNVIPIAIFGTQRFYASLSGYNFYDSLFFPEKMFLSQFNVFSEFKEIVFIPGAWPDYGAGVILPSAFGAVARWSKNYPPAIVKNVIDTKIISNIYIPDVKKDGLCFLYLKTLSYFKDKLNKKGKDVLRTIWSIGPGELLSFIWNIEDFFVNCYENTKLVHKLLDIVTNTIINWYKEQIDILDNVECLLITDDISGMLSRDLYKKILYPYHRKIRNEFRNLIAILHNDTKSEHIMDYFVDIGFDVWNIGCKENVEKVVREIGNDISIMGDLDPLILMQKGKPQDVKKACIEFIRKASKSSRFILSLGGGANENTPKENIYAIINTISEVSI